MRGLISAILAASAAMPAAWAWTNDATLNDSESDLFDRLDRVIASGNPSSAEIVSAFDLPPACAQGSCFFQLPEAMNSTFSSGNLRHSAEGLVFVLEQPKGPCIRIDRVAAHFGGSEPENECTDGGQCWYVDARHERGLLGFGLENQRATCVASVVINTFPDQRLHNQAR